MTKRKKREIPKDEKQVRRRRRERRGPWVWMLARIVLVRLQRGRAKTFQRHRRQGVVTVVVVVVHPPQLLPRFTTLPHISHLLLVIIALARLLLFFLLLHGTCTALLCFNTLFAIVICGMMGTTRMKRENAADRPDSGFSKYDITPRPHSMAPVLLLLRYRRRFFLPPDHHHHQKTVDRQTNPTATEKERVFTSRGVRVEEGRPSSSHR